ncbi:uncharacterized protein N7484_007031 [Penicillium longicatenatum]|uniref:uncharacterized protein n=1 Tax=Penicillium longicatenatum TaxID=1561947 RepID=UPI002547728B|nr:uncharacterized protein N7484_007031 [Penicillium longicatenatum]KAJ5639169.1 hypothetical protein N7484_007031 [Penicillium longicatenatum]
MSKLLSATEPEDPGANQQNNVVNLDAGTIPETSYNALCEAWQQTAANTTNAEESWAAFNKTRDLLNQFNKRHYLPQAWNISEAWAEGQIGTPNPRTGEEDITSTSDGASQPDPANKVLSSEESSGEPGSESESEADRSEPIGLDALEERTIKKQRRLTTARVLYWWPKGTGSQIFVRYGDKSAPIFRIRSGSHESYNPGKVERVLTKTRGTAKFTVIKDGLVEEFWKYTRKNVKDIIAIGWKIEDDDEEGINPLNLLQPTKGAIFPQTRVLVEWKDGRCTLEGRSFIRRITTGSALDGDRVIYQKAEELEIRYREKHGLEVFDEDYDYDDEDEESDYIRPRRADRRYRSEPTRYPRRVKPSTRSRFFSSEDSDESDTSIQSYNTRRRRHRSEPTHYSTTRRKTPPEKEISSTVKINQLERELRRLKMESSRSPPKRRDRRERTA